MNKKQRISLICGVLLLILSILFPPWTSTVNLRDGLTIQGSAGYAFIGKPPEKEINMITMDIVRLLVQGIGIMLLTGLVIFIFHSPKNRKTPEPNPAKWIPKSRSARLDNKG